MLTNIAASSVTLWLVSSVIRRLGGSLATTLAGMLACGGAASFVAFNNQFLVETVQVMGVTGMAWIAFQADRLSMLRLASGIIIWASLAMLAKTTSIAFILPFLVYIGIARLATQGGARAPARLSDYGLAVGAALVFVITVAWYAIHWSAVIGHVMEASSGDIALLYGSTRPFFDKLIFWSRHLLWALSPSLLFAVILLLVAAVGPSLAVARLLTSPVKNPVRVVVQSGALLYLLCVGGTIIAALLSYSRMIEEDPRFIRPAGSSRRPVAVGEPHAAGPYLGVKLCRRRASDQLGRGAIGRSGYHLGTLGPLGLVAGTSDQSPIRRSAYARGT